MFPRQIEPATSRVRDGGRRNRSALTRALALGLVALVASHAAADGDLVSLVTNIQPISTETFASNSGDVSDACITAGSHKVMRFDFIARNTGDAAIAVGLVTPGNPCGGGCPCPTTPTNGPFVWSNGHCHWHLQNFDSYQLAKPDETLLLTGGKQPFCLMDTTPWTTNNGGPFSCGNMGVSVGYEDVYGSGLSCQFMNMDGIPNGDYRIIASTNANQVVTEANVHNNAVSVPIRVSGTTVTQIGASWETRQTFSSPNVGFYPPSLVSWAPDRLDMFAIDVSAGHLMHHWKQNGSAWSAQEDLGAPPGTTLIQWPSAVSWAPGRLDMFARGADNRLWHKWWWNGWGGWENVGSASDVASPPRVISWGPNRLDIVYTSTAGNLRHIGWAGTFWGPLDDLGHPAGATVSDQPGAVSWGVNRIDMAAVGSDHRLWHIAWTGSGFTGWDNPGGVSTVGFRPEVVSWGPGRLDFFWAHSSSNAVQHIGFGGGWGPIDTFAGPSGVNVTNNQPVSVAMGPGRLDTFVRGSDGRLWHFNWQNGWTAWGAPYSFTDVATGPAVTSWAFNQLSVIFGAQAGGVGSVGLF